VDTPKVIETQPSSRDNLTRAVRSLLQFFVALLLSGAVVQVWNAYADSHPIDGTLRLAISLFFGFLVTYVQNQAEDKTGKGFLITADRKAGDAVLDSGIGAKTGSIVDTATEVPLNPNQIGFKPDSKP